MAWIPFWAAGVVNGIGHYWGYRNYNSPDTSTNVFPWGIVIGGEELHNNHHAHGTSAKFSAKWYEFDIGWCYISVLKFFGLAKIKKVAPKLKLESSAKAIDLRTLQGVITHRYEVMARYADIVKSAVREELDKLKPAQGEALSRLQRVRRWLHRNEEVLQPEQRAEVDQAIAQNQSLSTLVQMRRELGRLWESSSASSEQLLHDLQAWCQRAQQSGIAGLEQFALRLSRYAA
jgi:stearoyl-CoA desaturase (delta-9 desaturase)